jgi:hypothetical protein
MTDPSLPDPTAQSLYADVLRYQQKANTFGPILTPGCELP